MFGLSDETKKTETLLGDKPVQPISTSNTKPDVSSFDSLAQRSSANQQAPPKVTTNQNQSSFTSKYQIFSKSMNFAPIGKNPVA